MNAAQFVKEYQADASMTRACGVVLVETTDGYILARAESPYEVAYAASRTASKAMGRAASAAVWGDFRDAEAFEDPDAALAHVRSTPVDYH